MSSSSKSTSQLHNLINAMEGNAAKHDDGEEEEAPCKMKKTCERCSKSKIRCDGRMPCDKCEKRDKECIYVPEGKRGRRPKAGSTSSAKAASTKRTGDNEIMLPSKTTRMDRGRVAAATTTAIRDEKRSGAPPPSQPPPPAGQANRSISGGNACYDERWNLCSTQVQPSMNLAPMETFKSLDCRINDYERRLLRVFFALYKHHHTQSYACCRGWFSHQINKIWALWNDKGIYNTSEHAQFMKWIADHNLTARAPRPGTTNIPPNPVEDGTGHVLSPTLGALAPKFVDIAPLKRQPKKGTMKMDSPSSVLPAPSFLFAGGSANFRNENEPFRVKNLPYICILSTHEGSVCDCNDAFVRLTGFTAHDAMSLIYWTKDGFLPWGGDLVAIIADSDEATLDYIRLCSQHFAQLVYPPPLPTTRTVQFAIEWTIITKQGVKMPNLVLSVTINERLTVDRTEVDVLLVLSPPVSSVPKSGGISRAVSLMSSGAQQQPLGNGDVRRSMTPMEAMESRRNSLWSTTDDTLDGLDTSDIWELDDLPWTADMPGLPPAMPPAMRASSLTGLTVSSSGPDDSDCCDHVPSKSSPEQDAIWLNNLLEWVDME